MDIKVNQICADLPFNVELTARDASPELLYCLRQMAERRDIAYLEITPDALYPFAVKIKFSTLENPHKIVEKIKSFASL